MTQTSDMGVTRTAAKMTARSQNWLKVVIGLFVLLMVGDFIFGGIVPSLNTAKNDFSDPFIGSWLWAHRQNPYDRALVAAEAMHLIHSTLPVVPIYPLTAYVLIAPFSVLPWKWANFAWTVVSELGVGIICWTLVRIAGFKSSETRAWLLVGLIVGFAPLHRAVHTENAATIAVALCLLAVHMADKSSDLLAGVLLAIATGLKPQLGIWILFFYLVQARWRIVVPAVAGFAALLTVARLYILVSLPALFISYRDDLHYWFGPGGPNDFTGANSIRFQLVNVQVIFWQWWHNALTANIVAHVVFVLGLVIWMWGMTRGPLGTLGLTALLAMSFLSFYHSVTDVSILLLGFCWVLSSLNGRFGWTKLMVFLLLLGLSLPSHSLLLRLESHASYSATWWWTGIVAPLFIWNVLLLNIVLIFAVVRFGLNASPATDRLR